MGTSPAVMATVNGNSEYGLIFAQRNKSVTYNNIVYVNNVVTAYLDINGNLNDGALNAWIDLIPNANATPGDSYYVVTINIQGAIHSEIWIVPDQTNINVVSVRQSAPPPSGGTSAPVFFYQTLQQTGSNLTQRPALNLTGAGVNCLDNAGLLRTDCTITGSGSGTATTTNSGTVKTDVLAADPVVYLKTSNDTLLAGKVGTNRQVLTAGPLSGGGTLTADLTLTCPNCVISVTANSPLLSSGGTAPAISFAAQNANLVAAGPASGGAAAPTFRALVGADLPSPSATTLGGVQSLGVVASKWINTISTSGVPSATQPNFTDLAGAIASAQTPLTTRGDLLTLNAALALSRLALGSSGQCLTSNGTDTVWGPCSSGSGTVTSVALNVPGEFSVTGSPITASGTLAISKANQSANFVYAGPASGGAAAPTFRALAGADLPSPSATTLGGVQSIGVVASKWINTISISGVPSATQPAFGDISGTAAKGQVPATTVFTDQANTFGAFLQKFQAGTNFNFVDSLDATKIARFDLSNLTTATTRTVNVPDANSTLVQSSAAPANQFTNSVSAQGAVGYAQPSFANLSGAASDGQLASAYSGVGACAASKWASTLTRNAAPTCTQPSFSDISGAATKGQLPATAVYTDQANTFGAFLQKFQAGANFRFVDSVDTTKTAGFDLSNITAAMNRTVNVPDANSTTAQARAAVGSQWLNSMSAQGLYTSTQPAFTDVSGTATKAQLPATTAFTDQPNTWTTGAQDMGAAASLKVPVAAGLTTATNGLVGYDSTNNNLHTSSGATDMVIGVTPTATPIDQDCVKWVKTGGKIQLGDQGTICGGGGAPALSAITAAITSNTIANANNPQTWNWAQTADSQSGIKFSETSAATGGTLGNQSVLKVSTIVGSTASPLIVSNSLNGSQTLPTVAITPTWNTTGVVDAALLVNATNTASGAGSLLADLQIGGTSQWKADKAGNTTQLGGVSTGVSPPACTVGTAGTWCGGEGTAPTAAATVDQLWADAVAHRVKINNNNGTAHLVVAGLTAAATLTYTAIAANTCQEQAVAVTNSLTTDVATASPAATLGNVNLSWSAWVSAAGTVSVRVCNVTVGAITPAAVSWNLLVSQ